MSQGDTSRRSYERPTITRVGTVAELTLGMEEGGGGKGSGGKGKGKAKGKGTPGVIVEAGSF